MEVRSDLESVIKAGGPKLMNCLVTALAALSLSSAQGLREVTGSLFVTMIAEEHNPVVDKMLRAGKEYFEKVQEAGPDHGLGPPFLHVWKAMLEAILWEAASMPEAEAKIIHAYWTEVLCKTRLEELTDQVRFCQAKKHSKGRARCRSTRCRCE